MPQESSPLAESKAGKPDKKIVHLIRHGEGVHNLRYKNHNIRDPLLTPRGQKQCTALGETFSQSEQDKIELLVSSPLRRALYTTLYTFPDLVQRLNILALPEVQETGRSGKDCDRGLDPKELVEEFHDQPLDLSLVGEGWYERKGLMATDDDSLVARALWVRKWLRDRNEKVICVVAHGGFLDYLVQDKIRISKSGWDNCEWRTYEFQAGPEDENASLVEVQNRDTGEDWL